MWVRFNEPAGLDPITELVAIADALPPAAIRLTREPKPVSSMTWLFNILTADARDARRMVAAALDRRACPRRLFEPVDGDLEPRRRADRARHAERRGVRVGAFHPPPEGEGDRSRSEW